MRTTPMITAALVLAMPALAKTPDGLPPSVETVCDEYGGAAFGLCNAYCEAMDCDHPSVHASSRACSQVSSHFTRLTGEKLMCEADVQECEITPDSDEFKVSSVPEDGSGVFLDVLLGDTVEPPGTVLVVTGENSLEYDVEVEGEGIGLRTFSPGTGGTFQYMVCCDGTEICAFGDVLLTSN